MALQPRFRRILPAFLTLALLLAPAAGLAQEKKKKAKKKAKIAGDKPIAVISIASANRMLQDVEATFKSAGKPQIYDLIKGFLGNVDDLKGLNRDKPLGVMLFVTAGIPPSVTPIGFVPVKNIQDLLKSLSNGPFTSKKVPEKKGRYEISGPGGNTLYVEVRNDYAYVSNSEDSLDITVPDPSRSTAALAKRYDIAASINLNAISDTSRTLFAGILRTSAEGELQQRDDEPEMAYKARRARGMRDLAWLEAFLLDCESVMIGLDASAEKKTVVFEAALDARSKSKLAKMVKKIGAKRSYFDNLLNEKVPLSVSVSWGLNEHERKMFAESFNFLGGRMAYILDPKTIEKRKEERKAEEKRRAEAKKKAEANPKEDARTQRERIRELRRQRAQRIRAEMRKVQKFSKDSPVAKVVESLIATSEKGHADFFMQFVGEPPSKFTFLAGAGVQQGRQFAAGMVDLFRNVQKIENAPKITVNAETYKGIAFHRVHFGKPPRQMQQFFGESPSLYIGASSRAVWVAMGGDAALGKLQNAIDKVILNKNTGAKRKVVAPLRITVNVAQWLAMAGEGNGNPNNPANIARKAFAKGGDAIRVEVRTTDNGIRARVQLDEGFMKMLGMLIASGYERSRGI